MRYKLNIQPQTLSYGSVTNLLNGALASLSGPIGFSLPQPRIVVKRVWVVNPSTSTPIVVELFKGSSGGSASGTLVAEGNIPVNSTVEFPIGDIVLESGDFLTGAPQSSGGTPVVNIDAEIEF